MNLSDDAMQVSLRITAWSGRLYDRQASNHVAVHHDASASAGRYNKRLLPKAAFAALTATMSAIRTAHYENSLPWDDQGLRLLTVANYDHYTELMDGFRERIGAACAGARSRWRWCAAPIPYEGYNAIARETGLTRVYCFAHVRRQFTDALKALGLNPRKLPDKAPDKARRALRGLSFIRNLYAIEHRARGEPPDERKRIRDHHSRPVLDTLHAWVEANRPKVAPSTPLGKALAYLHRHWDGLVVFLQDGRLEIDNNRVENAIRPFVVGRKNWLFSATVAGAHASANLYSLIETAKANGLEPYAYLRYLFTELPKADTVEVIEALLPYNLDPAAITL